MRWPQITVIVIMAINLGINLVMHGKPKKEDYNFFKECINDAILIVLLIYGGFWTN